MNLNLTDQQVAYLVQALAQRPYMEVAELIAVIHRQASAQVPHAVPAVSSDAPVTNDSSESQPCL